MLVSHEGLGWQVPKNLLELESVNRLLGLGSGQGWGLAQGWVSGAECQVSSDSRCGWVVGLKHGHILPGRLGWLVGAFPPASSDPGTPGSGGRRAEAWGPGMHKHSPCTHRALLCSRLRAGTQGPSRGTHCRGSSQPVATTRKDEGLVGEACELAAVGVPGGMETWDPPVGCGLEWSRPLPPTVVGVTTTRAQEERGTPPWETQTWHETPVAPAGLGLRCFWDMGLSR